MATCLFEFLAPRAHERLEFIEQIVIAVAHRADEERHERA